MFGRGFEILKDQGNMNGNLEMKKLTATQERREGARNDTANTDGVLVLGKPRVIMQGASSGSDIRKRENLHYSQVHSASQLPSGVNHLRWSFTVLESFPTLGREERFGFLKDC